MYKNTTFLNGSYIAFINNMVLIMLLFSICRLLFFLFNRDFFPDTAADQIWSIFVGGLRLDISALTLANLVYIVFFIIPFKFRYNAVYQKALKWFFVAVNSIMIGANCADIIYFRFTLRRTTADVFSEFAAESNLGVLLKHFIADFWYMWLIWIVLIVILIVLYRKAQQPEFKNVIKPNVIFYSSSVAVLVLVVLLSIVCIRGGFGITTRPITLSNAGQYVKKPLEMCIVQNTPFCIFRTIGQEKLTKATFFDNQDELNAAYNPVIMPDSTQTFKPMNVVIIIWESLSREHVGSLNKNLNNGNYKGYTPFLDTLVDQGLTFTSSYANGRKSIEAMPSILAGIPSLSIPFVLSSFSSNEINSVANLLKEKGYISSLFYGTTNSSMGFWAFARMAGVETFYGQDAYGNLADHDGTWGIWDEDFLQFTAQKLSEQKQPFCSTVITMSSHHPCKVPQKYKDIFPEEDNEPILKCMRYTDFALRRFFETISKQAWYNNTLFVLTGDHTGRHIFPESRNTADQMSVPIIFFTPDGTVCGIIDNVVQHSDILPTIMALLNYDKPFVAFGQNAIDQSQEQYAINFVNGVYHIYYRQYLLLFNGKQSTALYDIKSDRMMKNNIIGQHENIRLQLETRVKGFIQQYNNRMIDNCLTLDCTKLQI